MTEDRQEGQEEARTPAAPSPAELLAAMVDRLAGRVGGTVDGDQLDLLDGSPDVEATDTLGAAAETVARERRARGRPAGSRNKRNTALFDLLEALGHRDPGVTLSLIQTADTLALAKALGAPAIVEGRPVRDIDGSIVYIPANPVDIMKIQEKAAADLMNYKYAKQHKLEVDRRETHFFVAGQLGNGQLPGAAKGLSIFGGNIEENQRVIEEASVRHELGESHDNANPLETNDNPDKSD